MEHFTNIFEGLVTHILDPYNIWLRCGTDRDIRQFRIYQMELDSIYNEHGDSYPCDVKSLCRGSSIVVGDRLVQPCTWRRAYVQQSWDEETDTIDVYLIDLGYSEIVKQCQLRAFPREFQTLPSQAVPVCLAGVKPLAASWTNRARTFLEALLLNQYILVSFVPPDLECSHDAVAIYISKPHGEWHSVIHEMQTEELAVLTGTIPEILTVDAAVAGLDFTNLQQREQLMLNRLHEGFEIDYPVLGSLVGGFSPENSDNHGRERPHRCNHISHHGCVGHHGNEEMVGRGANRVAPEVHSQPLMFENVHFDHDGEPQRSNESRGIMDMIMEHARSVISRREHPVHPQLPLSSSHSEALSNSDQVEEPSAEAISHVDLGFLAQRTSLSINKLQQARQDELKRVTRDNILASIDNDANDLVSVSEDQDWDAVRDIDTHDDIQSQIHKLVQRQISDGEGTRFAFEVEQLSRGIIQSPAPQVRDQMSRVSEQKANDKHETKKSERGKKSSQNSNASLMSQEDKEIKEYRVVKQIQEILSDPENNGADVISAFIHSIVEPDVEVPRDDLRTVFYALLDHTICKSNQEQEMALGVLETYSDTNCFLEAMHEVLLNLKDEYVKRVQSVRQEGKHKHFARMLSLIFNNANDWDQRSSRDIQEFICRFIHNWVVFNRTRHQTEDTHFNTELMYLECVEVFLFVCFDTLQEKFQETVSDLMAEIRHKLVHDSTPRWIRERLLDLLLNMNYKGGFMKGRKETKNSSTQTAKDPAFVIGGNSKDCDTKYSRDSVISVTTLNDSSEASMLSGKQKDRTSQIPSSDLPSPTGGSNSSAKQFLFYNTSNLNVQQTVADKDTPSRRPSDRYSWEASNLLLNTLKCSPDFDWQPNSEPSLSWPVPRALPCSKKRGVPKFIRNLPPHLLRKCQEDNPPRCLNRQHVSLIEQPNNSSIHSIPVSSNPLQREESETSLEVIGNNNIHKFGDYFFKDSESQKEKKNISLSPQQIHLEGPRTHVSSEVLSADIEDSSIMNSVTNNTSDIFQPESDHQCEERGHQDEENDHQDQVSDHQSEKNDRQSEEEDTEDKTEDEVKSMIKYTVTELREMNPDKSNSPLPLEELFEPHEILEKMIAQTRKAINEYDLNDHDSKVIGTFSRRNDQQDQSAAFVETRKSPLMAGANIEEGSNYLPADNTDILKSHSPNFTAENETETLNFQNVHGFPPASITPTKTFSDRNTSGAKGSLKDIGEILLVPTVTEINTESESQSNADNEAESWHDDTAGHLTFDVKENISEEHSCKGKGKKKKLKYRPLDFFKSTTPIANDGSGDADIDAESLDEFSPEALRMYEALEKEEKEKEALLAVGGEVLSFSKFGGSATSDTKRPSLFAEVRQRYQAPKPPKPWCPGKRKCTRCGSEEHTVYDCQDDGSSLYK